ncbi:MAG TPA: hypothetical protein VL179_00310 [Mycobacterium sp.]|nr:hypothetical protein [Mycobacterium sp.]
MVEYVVAQGGGAPWIGPAVRAALFTAVGVALIVIGVRRRLDRARWDGEDDSRLLNPDGPVPSDEHRSPTPRSGGGWLTAAGAVLAFLGLLHTLDLVATLHESGVI